MSSDLNGVLFGGISSSGSTLLSIMMDAHPEIVCGPESTLFCHPVLWDSHKFKHCKDTAEKILFQKISLDGVIDFSIPHEEYLEYYGFNKKKVLKLVEESKDYYDFSQFFFKGVIEKYNAKVWVEKTPKNLYAIDSFVRNNSKAKAILIVRDPRGILNSLINRGVKAETAAASLIVELNIIHSLMQDRTINNRILVIRYEDIIFNTESVCRNICNYLNVNTEFISNMIQRIDSSRQGDIGSLEESLLKVWSSNPLNEIDVKPASSWKSNLKVCSFELLFCTTTGKNHISQYVKNPIVEEMGALMDYLGYTPGFKHEKQIGNNTIYDSFYASRTERVFVFDKYKSFSSQVKRLFLSMKWYSLKRYLRRVPGGIKRVPGGIKRVLGRIKRRVLGGIKRVFARIFNKLHIVFLKIKPNYNKKYKWYPPKNIDNNIDIVVTIAFLGRHKVLHAVIEEILNSRSQPLNVYVVLTCSNDKDFEFSKKMLEIYKKVGIVVCDNKPIGNKWHISVEAAKRLNPRALLITGSDDLVSSDYLYNNFNTLTADSLKTIGMVGPRSWYMYNLYHDDLYKVSYNDSHHKVPLGAGRLYSRDYLDSIKWKLFDRGRNKALDSKGYHRVIKEGLSVHIPSFDDGCILSIKGDWSAINSFDKILKADSIIHSKVSNREKDILLHRFKNSFEILKDCK